MSKYWNFEDYKNTLVPIPSKQEAIVRYQAKVNALAEQQGDSMSINLKQAGLTLEEAQTIIDALRVQAGLDNYLALREYQDAALDLLNKLTGGDTA